MVSVEMVALARNDMCTFLFLPTEVNYTEVDYGAVI